MSSQTSCHHGGVTGKRCKDRFSANSLSPSATVRSCAKCAHMFPNLSKLMSTVSGPSELTPKRQKTQLASTREKYSEDANLLWMQMRWLERQYFPDDNSGPRTRDAATLPSLATEVIKKPFLEEECVGQASERGQCQDEQYKKLQARWKSYMLTFITEKDLDMESALFVYSNSSHPFNGFLNCVKDKNKKELKSPPTEVDYVGCDRNNNPLHLSIDPDFEEQDYRVLVGKLHETIINAPATTEIMHFMRSVNSPGELIHRKFGIYKPELGQVFPSTQFVSTAATGPSSYLEQNSDFDVFFDYDTMCCQMLLTVNAGIQIVPLALGGGTFNEQAEVLLPPGLLFVYRGSVHKLVPLTEANKQPGMVKIEIVMYDVHATPQMQQTNSVM